MFLKVGNRYAALIGDNSAEPSITKFFGFFFMFFQTSQIWGNLISSLGIENVLIIRLLLFLKRIFHYYLQQFCLRTHRTAKKAMNFWNFVGPISATV